MPFMINEDTIASMIVEYLDQLKMLEHKDLQIIHFITFLEYILSFYYVGAAS